MTSYCSYEVGLTQVNSADARHLSSKLTVKRGKHSKQHSKPWILHFRMQNHESPPTTTITLHTYTCTHTRTHRQLMFLITRCNLNCCLHHQSQVSFRPFDPHNVLTYISQCRDTTEATAYPCLLMVKFQKKVFVKDISNRKDLNLVILWLLFPHSTVLWWFQHQTQCGLLKHIFCVHVGSFNPQSLQTVNSLFCAKIQTIEVL